MLNRIVSGETGPVPLVQGTIASALYTSRVIFGREALEIRGAGKSRFGGMFGIKEYPATTKSGMLNGLLKAPFEFILTQSFGFMSKSAGAAIMSRKQNQMVSSGDKAISQLVELDQALDNLQSNRFVLGEHHLTMLVYADDLRALPENMSMARAMLARGGAVIAREVRNVSKSAGSLGAKGGGRVSKSTNTQRRALILPHEVTVSKVFQLLKGVSARLLYRSCGGLD
jgi:type IV secretion system protein VirB4